MTYEVTLETPRDVYTFTVDMAEFTDDMNGDALIMFRGLDPYDCPDPLRDEFQFHSKNLTATIEDNSIIEDLTVKPTVLPNNTE